MGNQIDKNAQGEKGMSYQYKLLGLVTLYNPDTRKAIDNIKRYAYELDMLIIWDNSPLEADYRHQILNELSDITDRIIWHGTGENLCIAPAIMPYKKDMTCYSLWTKTVNGTLSPTIDSK